MIEAQRGEDMQSRPGCVAVYLQVSPGRLRRHTDDAKEEIHLRQGPGPGSSRLVVVIGVSSSRLRVLHTFSLLSLVGWPL